MSKTYRNAVIISVVLLAVVVLSSALSVDWMN